MTEMYEEPYMSGWKYITWAKSFELVNNPFQISFLFINRIFSVISHLNGIKKIS